nr:hypothetical protein [uncultured Undibacterium sp.]
MVAAYQLGAYTMAEIARYIDVHYMTVSRAVRAAEGDFDGCIHVGTAPILL